MAITADFVADWSADQDPYTSTDFTYLNGQVKIVDGGLRPTSGDAMRKVIYAGAVSGSEDPAASIMPAASGILWNDAIGPALFSPSDGSGYWLRINGNEAKIYRQGAGSTSLDTHIGSTETVADLLSSDVFKLTQAANGDLVASRNGVELIAVNDTTYAGSVKPAAACYRQNNNLQGMSSFGADGLVDGTLTITDVNGTDVIVSNGPIEIAGTRCDLATSATLTNGVETEALTITAQTVDSITCAPVDVHDTEFYPGETLAVEISDGSSTPQQVVSLESEPGYEYTITTSIDATDGLLKDVTGTPAIGDGYDGQTVIDQSNITYYAAGPHRMIDPALSSGTESTGYFYDASARTWEIMEETTNQPGVEAPVWKGAPSPPAAAVGVSYIYSFAHLITGDPVLTAQNVGAPLPSGLSIVGLEILGTPLEAGSVNSLVIRAVNGAGTAESTPFTILVNEDPNASGLFWNTIPPIANTEGESTDYDVSPYVGGAVGALTGWGLVGGPSGFGISEGIITAASTVATGSYALIPEVSDEDETESAAPFIWTIDVAQPVDLPDITAAMRRVVVYETITAPYPFTQAVGAITPYSINVQPILDSRKTTVHSVEWDGGGNISVTNQIESGAICYAELTVSRAGTRTAVVEVTFNNGTTKKVYIEIKAMSDEERSGNDYA